MVAAGSFVSAFTLTTLSSASAILQAVPLAVTLGAAAAPDLLRLGAAFVVGGAGYLAIVSATRTGEVAAVVPFRYTRLVFAMLLGALVFGERPGRLMLAGAALVVGAGPYTIWRKTVTRHAPCRRRRPPADRDMVTVN